MAPSNETLEKYLKDATRRLYKADPNTVTVNSVRQDAQERNGLENGFFVTPEWKSRSKALITGFVQQHLSEEPSSPVSKSESKQDTKSGVKRSSSDEASLPAKRRKSASTAVAKTAKPKKEESSSALSDLEDSDFDSDGKAEKKKMTNKNTIARKAEPDSELSELDLSEDEPKPKKKAKRPASSRKSKVSKKEESESSDLSDLDSEDEPKQAKKKGPKSAKLEDYDSDEKDGKKTSTTGPRRKQHASTVSRNAKRAKAESESEDELSVKNKVGDNTADKDIKSGNAKDEEAQEDTKLQNNESKPSVGDDSDSSLSSVLDEPPVKKRKSKGEKAAPKARQAVSKELTSDEVEIRKLQGQLVKCGVRKIWGIELKKYGSDSRAKIRHLREMLREVGMDGRFSEAKAREIKERRELMGELEAVNEMNELWGIDAPKGRASRSKASRKSLKEESDDDEEELKAEDNEEEDTKVKTNPRVSKRMADLAFLGSESESD